MLSLSPSWNLDSYVRLVYHAMFKTAILDKIKAREEELAVKGPLGPVELLAAAGGADTANPLAEATEGTAGPEHDGRPNSEEKQGEDDKQPGEHENEASAEDANNDDIKLDEPSVDREDARHRGGEPADEDQPVIAEVEGRFNWN